MVEFKIRVEERYLELKTVQKIEEIFEVEYLEEENDLNIKIEPVEDVVKFEESDDENVPLERLVKQQRTRKKSKTKKYQCVLCEKEMTNYREYIDHKKIHLNCTMCNRTFSTSKQCFGHYRSAHIKINKVMISCDLCGKLYNGINALKIHKVSHSDDRPFSCDLCDYKSKTKPRLSLHKISMHLPPEEKLQQQPVKKQYICSYCGQICSSKTSLKEHTMIHTNEYSYECSTCKKEFRNRTSYKKHLLIHTGIKPHKCDICQQSFRLLDFLKKHKITHGAEKKYLCTICGMSTAYKESLDLHIKSVHMNIKKYICPNCGEKYLKPSILKRHMMQKHPEVQPDELN